VPELDLHANFPLTPFVREVSPNDAMFDTSDHYLSVGLSALQIIEYAIVRRYTPADDLKTILDLPCGHGRIARVLRSRFPDVDLTVCDIDRDGVDFCINKFGASGVYGTNDFGSLNFGKLFDLIWVGSLVTHFSADQTVNFIRCMTRHLAPAGLLIITSHGRAVIRNPILSAVHFGLIYPRGPDGTFSIFHMINNTRIRYQTISNINRQYHHMGYGYSDDPHIGAYGFSIISRQWFEELFKRGTHAIVEYLEQAWDNRQDVLFVKERSN